MVLKLTQLFFFSILILAAACTRTGGPTEVDLRNDDDKTLYAMGATIGQRFTELKLSQHELNALALGFHDMANGEEPRVKLEEYRPKVPELMKTRRETVTKVQVEENGRAYMKKFIEEGGVLADSGLAYKILEPGEGATPTEDDTLIFHYHGTLVNDRVFDSSRNRGEKMVQSFKEMSAGWVEALKLLRPGGRIKVVLPPELAYGKVGHPPMIPGGATIVYEFKFYGVK